MSINLTYVLHDLAPGEHLVGTAGLPGTPATSLYHDTVNGHAYVPRINSAGTLEMQRIDSFGATSFSSTMQTNIATKVLILGTETEQTGWLGALTTTDPSEIFLAYPDTLPSQGDPASTLKYIDSIDGLPIDDGTGVLSYPTVQAKVFSTTLVAQYGGAVVDRQLTPVEVATAAAEVKLTGFPNDDATSIFYSLNNGTLNLASLSVADEYPKQMVINTDTPASVEVMTAIRANNPIFITSDMNTFLTGHSGVQGTVVFYQVDIPATMTRTAKWFYVKVVGDGIDPDVVISLKFGDNFAYTFPAPVAASFPWLDIKILNAMPAQADLVPSCMYIIKGTEADEANVHFSDSNGAMSVELMNTAKITTKISTALSTFSQSIFVTNIADRNALALTRSVVIMVADASADSTVGSGGAAYMFNADTGTYTKIYEFEGMDVTPQWDNIVGKPTSTTAQLDDMATNGHSHANAAILDATTESADGNLVYNGVEHTGFAKITTEAW